jgi:hypothetical protein
MGPHAGSIALRFSAVGVKQLTSNFAGLCHCKATGGDRLMKHQFPSARDASEVTSGESSSSERYLAGVVDALHASRRLQAARVIHHYRHLVHEECVQDASKAAEAQPLEDNAPQFAPERQSWKSRTIMISKLLIATAIVGFAFLHAVGYGAMRQATVLQPTEDSMPLANRD